MISFGNFCSFFEVFKFLRKSVKLLSRISEKVIIYVLKKKTKKKQMEKKTNKGKLEIFKFLRISALSQGYSL